MDGMFDPLSSEELTAAAPPGKPPTKTPILPVPADAPPMAFRHPQYGEPTRTWAYHDAEGRLLGYVARFDFTGKDGQPDKDVLPVAYCDLGEGRRGWRSKGIPEPRPLYKLPGILARPDAAVLVAEGEKASDAAAELFPDLVTTTTMGGAKAPKKTDWAPLKGRTVIIWPDADKAGADFAAAVADLVTAAGAASVAIVTLPDGLPEGWDLADDVPAGIDLAGLLAAAEPMADADAESQAPPPAVSGFLMKPNGLCYRDADPEKEDILLSGPFEVVAETRDTIGGSWGVLVRWKDHDDREHEWSMPRALLAGDGSEFRRALLDGGLYVAPGRRARELLTAYLASVRVKARATCVDRTGWHGRVYVSAGRSYGDTAGERILLQGSGAPTETRPRSTLKGWKAEVAAPCVGNSRLAFALSAAFAGPLLFLLGLEGGGLHFVGPSSIGKSSALHVAASAWGCPVYNWRSTDNAAEGLARAANDALLCLDELGQANGHAADAMGYMLSNGTGKARMSRDITNRPLSTWRVLFVSTGEISLSEKLAEVGRKTKAGQEVRILDIQADAGCGMGAFENLHHSKDGDAFARRIRLATETHRGHAAHAFLERITAGNLDELTTAVRAGCERWKAEHIPAGSDGQVQRAAGRFALIAAAGELAATMGILPWPAHEAERAAAACFNAWLEARGGNGPAEITAGIAQVRAFIEAHGMSRFEPAWERDTAGNSVEARINNRVGFRRKDSEGRWEYFVLSSGFQEMTKGFNSKTMAAEMVKAGLLRSGADGKTSISVTIPGQGKVRSYHIVAGVGGDG